jgi:hypothetical protein
MTPLARFLAVVGVMVARAGRCMGLQVASERPIGDPCGPLPDEPNAHVTPILCRVAHQCCSVGCQWVIAALGGCEARPPPPTQPS